MSVRKRNNHGTIVFDSKYCRYGVSIDIPSSIKTRKEAIAFLDGYGAALAHERGMNYQYAQTIISFDTETERI